VWCRCVCVSDLLCCVLCWCVCGGVMFVRPLGWGGNKEKIRRPSAAGGLGSGHQPANTQATAEAVGGHTRSAEYLGWLPSWSACVCANCERERARPALARRRVRARRDLVTASRKKEISDRPRTAPQTDPPVASAPRRRRRHRRRRLADTTLDGNNTPHHSWHDETTHLAPADSFLIPCAPAGATTHRAARCPPSCLARD